MASIKNYLEFYGLSAPEPRRRITFRPPPQRDELSLKTLYKPSEPAEPLYDIVAVHGIAAHPYYSWVYHDKEAAATGRANKDENPRREVHWLKDEDMLPRDCSQAQIMSFGYESQWFGKDSIKTRLATVADSLLSALKSERMVNTSLERLITVETNIIPQKQTGRASQFRPILFIGHCFGGLVIQKVIPSINQVTVVKLTPKKGLGQGKAGRA